MAKALASSHDAGVVHRDLKPGNILVSVASGDFSFKVSDFGIALLTEEELERAHRDEASITGSSTMFGALPYMSPEIIESPKAAGKASDVWALGAVLYTVLTGEHPFGTGLKAIPRIMEGKGPSKPALLGKLPQFASLEEEIWTQILRCMQFKPEDRPPAKDVASTFADFCYSTHPRSEGAIEKFRHADYGAYGFIATDGESVFFHKDSFYGEQPSVGMKVLFCTFPGDPRPRAHPVVPLKN